MSQNFVTRDASTTNLLALKMVMVASGSFFAIIHNNTDRKTLAALCNDKNYILLEE